MTQDRHGFSFQLLDAIAKYNRVSQMSYRALRTMSGDMLETNPYFVNYVVKQNTPISTVACLGKLLTIVNGGSRDHFSFMYKQESTTASLLLEADSRLGALRYFKSLNSKQISIIRSRRRKPSRQQEPNFNRSGILKRFLAKRS
jgi:hypothetical protein